MSRFRPRAVLIPAIAMLSFVGAGLVYAQLDGADRGIPPIDSTTNFEVLGVEVDVTADSAEKARLEGWRRAQAQGWKMLWAKTNNRPISQAPNLSESVLNSIVAGIVIEQEQVSPRRYIARLGVLFDRARTGEMPTSEPRTARSIMFGPRARGSIRCSSISARPGDGAAAGGG